jgi:hypothetical protein
MTLVDLSEMLCDWVAATDYGQNGSIQKSIDYNRQRPTNWSRSSKTPLAG